MALDPSIALGVRPIELPNQLAQYGQLAAIQNAQNQNALAQYQLSSAQRADEQQNSLYAAARQPNFKLDFQSAIKYGAPGIAAFKAQEEAAAAGLTRKKVQGEITAQDIKAASDRNDAFSTVLAPFVQNIQNKKPILYDDVVAQAKRLVAQGLMRDEDLSIIPTDQAALPQFIMNIATSTEKSRKALEPFLQKIKQQDTGSAFTPIQDNPLLPGYGLPVQGMASLAKTETPGERLTAKTAAAGQQVTMRGQNMTASTAAAGQGVTKRGQDLTDARAKENIAIAKETQRREADPAFQQQIAQARALGVNIAKDKVVRNAALPKVLDTAEMTLSEIDGLIGKRDAKGKLLEGEKPHPGFEGTVGATYLPGMRFIPGTAQSDFQTRFDQIKGGAFLQAFETLKGGGSITVVEGDKATAALNRMSLAQSEPEFLQAAQEFKGIISKGVARAKKLAGSTGAGAGAATGVDTSNPLLN